MFLKQSKDGKPSGITRDKYIEVLQEYFKANWRKKILDGYFHVKNPLYTSQIYMPLMSANEAPAAFQVEKEVKPILWAILYEGSFQVPERGQYRLAGYADNVLVVRLNGQTVLDGSRLALLGDKNLAKQYFADVPRQEVKPEHKIANGGMIYSDWLSLEPGQVNQMDILLGEHGGLFCAFLFIEKKGKKYKTEASGRPVLPLFRTADLDVAVDPEAVFEKEGPVFGMP